VEVCRVGTGVSESGGVWVWFGEFGEFGLEKMHVRHRLVVGARAVCSVLHCVLDFGMSILASAPVITSDFINVPTLVCLGWSLRLGCRLRASNPSVDDY
jgi:hypothetical protein